MEAEGRGRGVATYPGEGRAEHACHHFAKRDTLGEDEGICDKCDGEMRS